MSKKIAITGRPGCGKTTLCRRVAEKFEGRVGGLITEEIRQGGKRVGFQLEDLATGDSGLLSHVEECSGPRVGKYSVCQDQLDTLSSRAIGQNMEKIDLLIIDEIGPMELKSEKFVGAVDSSLKADVNCLFTVHRRSNHPLLQQIRRDFQVKKLTRNNREGMVDKLLTAFSI